VARWVTATGAPLTVNAVIHRANVARAGAMVELAIALGARRVEIAHAQYYGWGLRNRATLMPSAAEVEASSPKSSV
jgi:pyrroloquinoline quinone biosynthesis protein E